MNNMERLQKVLAKAGIASRRKAEQLILDGRVTVDGEVITELGYKVKKKSIVCFDGKEIGGEEKVYYLLHKPKKCISAVSDDRGRQTVVDIVKVEQRIYPVGRLDYDTSGVLFLTNDGEFSNEMTHPRFHLPKTYEVRINGILTSKEEMELKKGVVLDDGVKTLPAKVRVLSTDRNLKRTHFLLTIAEGKNRQVKRMVEAIGHELTSLHRSYFAFVGCQDLQPGEYRRLKPFEVKRLRALANQGADL